MIRAFVIALIAILFTLPSTGQPASSDAVVFQGSLRSRVEMWDWFSAPPANNNYALSGNLLRLGLSQTKKNFDWQIEFAVPILLGLPDNAIAPGTPGQLGFGASYYASNKLSQNAAMIFAKQAFMRWKGPKQSLRVGRFEFSDGAERTPANTTLAAIKRDRVNQRLIGPFGFSHVGRSFDGFQYAWTEKNATYTLISAVPTRGVLQTDGWGWNRTEVTYGSAVWAMQKGGAASETRVLGIFYDDFRHVVKTDSRPLAVRRNDLANIRIFTFGGHHLSAFSGRQGTFDVMLWGVGQTGKWGVQDHRAHAIAIEGGFQPAFAKPLKPWIRGGYFISSGDGNPNDNEHDTFFQMLPTARVFARFPFFDMLNNRDINAALITRPHVKVTISNEFHALRLSNPNDLWYTGGGVFQPWTFGYSGRNALGARSLANLYDLSVEYRMNPAFAFTGYFGYAQGLAVMKAIYPQGKDGRLGYLEFTYRFGRPAVKLH